MAGSGMESSGWGVFSTDAGQLVTAAVVGGTAAELGGGKFANGAVTGADTMLFNHMAHKPEDPPVVETGEGSNEGKYSDEYGDTFLERLKNLPRAMWKGDVGELPEGIISLSMADNPISLLVPFSSISKSTVGIRVVLGGSETTLIPSAFFKDIGISGMYGAKIWTPFGYARSWETLLGRWLGVGTTPLLIYDRFNGNENK
ncbi:MAG: hypothetical protein AB2L24_03790 [Mangrovibacterium sp.]